MRNSLTSETHCIRIHPRSNIHTGDTVIQSTRVTDNPPDPLLYNPPDPLLYNPPDPLLYNPPDPLLYYPPESLTIHPTHCYSIHHGRVDSIVWIALRLFYCFCLLSILLASDFVLFFPSGSIKVYHHSG